MYLQTFRTNVSGIFAAAKPLFIKNTVCIRKKAVILCFPQTLIYIVFKLFQIKRGNPIFRSLSIVYTHFTIFASLFSDFPLGYH